VAACDKLSCPELVNFKAFLLAVDADLKVNSGRDGRPTVRVQG
jgi:hypothetical protein